jgi:hypothetical protein
MKKIFASLVFTLMFVRGFSQTVVHNDNMESSGWTWKGTPRVLLDSHYTGGNSSASDFPSNSHLYTSCDSSFALFGTGLGGSTAERDTLSFCNITGLDPNANYQIRFRMCSIGICPATNAAAGVDAGDYIQIQYSSNGGATFINEMKFVGLSNSMWGFSGGIQTTKNANGQLSTFSYSALFPTTSLGLNLPAGITQLSFNVIMVTNASGESWLIDDVELVELTCLPVELLHFSAESVDGGNLVKWATASEINNDYFSLFSSSDASEFKKVTDMKGAGNSNYLNEYSFFDSEKCNSTIYYKLCQTDYDGLHECFDLIAVRCKGEDAKRLVRTLNLIGQEVDESFEGPRILIYDDGSAEKSK